ncbi:OmpA family protein [Endozoicomonas sp. 8E]|uniref:OmpA family protein n=1 Tax=Endozoicomonas sp. 8E TaxID=3035692 RepID=UPI002938EECB|nr:OmpA family protein [Endozoicomonas sp. 8E]WOG26558.1 OmpA family protein [Endozoicomonas sp. 8E]
MSARMLSTFAIIFSLLFTAGCSTSSSQTQPQKPHWSDCMAKGGVVMGIPGAAYNMATGGAALVAGALIGGTACATANPVAEPEDPMGTAGVEEMPTVNFDFDSSRLRSGDLEMLNTLIGQLDQESHIEIVGHACEIGSRSYNQKLSERRAEAVKDFLVSRGIPEENMTVRGEGADHPLRGNDTEAMRQENRRAEIMLK